MESELPTKKIKFLNAADMEDESVKSADMEGESRTKRTESIVQSTMKEESSVAISEMQLESAADKVKSSDKDESPTSRVRIEDQLTDGIYSMKASSSDISKIDDELSAGKTENEGDSATDESTLEADSLTDMTELEGITAAGKFDAENESKTLTEAGKTAEEKANLECISPTGKVETRYDAGEGSSKMNIKGKWKRLATARELFYGMRSDGVVLSTCVQIQINSREEINYEKFEKCVQHFNKNLKCFCEYITEGNENEFWLAVQNESTCTIEQVLEPNRRSKDIVEEIINSRSTPENTHSWQLHYLYKGKITVTLEGDVTAKYPHIYQLIFSFHTGTIDDYSCAMVCNLFLNDLDCIIKNKPMSMYSHLDLYNIGSRMQEYIEQENKAYQLLHKEKAKFWLALNQGCISNFIFPSTIIRDTSQRPRFKMRKIMLSSNTTEDFFITCDDLELSVYTYLIAIFNNIILKVAQDTYFGDANLKIKILHHINTKWLCDNKDKYMHQVGSHMLPILHYIDINSAENEFMFDQANNIESVLEDMTRSRILFYQEWARHKGINQMSKSYKTGLWNPKYFYSLCNLGNLDFIYREHVDNSFYTFRYDRARALQDDVCMDIKFYVFKRRLNFCIDFSTEFVSDEEVEDILDMLKESFSLL